MAQPQLFQRPVLLDRDRHRKLRLRPGNSAAFLSQLNALVLTGPEFADAAREYPVVFARAGERIQPVAMLGLRDGENLFVEADGRWSGRYLPAAGRRYPFVLADLPDQQLALCIDEAWSGWNEEEGEPLFDQTGAETAFLRNALEFLERYQREARRTEAFCQRLAAAGLLKEMSARAELKDGRRFTVNQLLVVDEPKLLQLPDATVLELFRAGELHLVSLHLASMRNLQALVDRLAQRPAPLQSAPAPRT